MGTLFLCGLLFLFLPWTQNIQADGKTIPLNPADRPQTIDATIPGRIERWYVREGDRLRKGDTILFLSEVKADYFDPALVARAQSRVANKEAAITAYQMKIQALDAYKVTLRNELSLRQQAVRNSIQQVVLKIDVDSIEWNRLKQDMQIARIQLNPYPGPQPARHQEYGRSGRKKV